MKTSIAIVMLTPVCNMSCNFCITEDGFSSMTFGQAAGLLKDLKVRSVSSVVFGGGEPFAWQHDLIEICRVAKGIGFFVQVGTNGIALPGGFEEISSIDRYVLPLESADGALHNRERLYKNRHHEIILERLKRLKEAGKSVTVSTVVTRRTLGGLEALGRFLQRYREQGGNLHAWHLYNFVPEGRGGRIHAPLLSIEDSTYEEVCASLKNRNFGFPVFKRKNMFRSRTIEFFPKLITGGLPCPTRSSPIISEEIMTVSMNSSGPSRG